MSEWEKGGVKIRGIVTNEVTKFQGSAQCSVDGGGAGAIGFQRSSCRHGHARTAQYSPVQPSTAK